MVGINHLKINFMNEPTNDLRHTISTRDADDNDLIIKIRLNDECKNGHQDFSITATAWEKGKPHNDRNFLYGGCSHEEVLKAHPELQIFANLHLCDYSGVPMHCNANGFYHLKNGFNNTPAASAEFATEFCKYYRVTPEQFDVLKGAEDIEHYAYLLLSLNVLEQWEIEATKAMLLLEEWTGKKFVCDSVRSNFDGLTPEKIIQIEARIKEGYYSPEALQARASEKAKAKLQKKFDDIKSDMDKTIAKAKAEYNVNFAVLKGGLPPDNFIYYSHTNEAVFNWNTSSYNRAITQDEFDLFMSTLDMAGLPEGIKFKLGK